MCGLIGIIPIKNTYISQAMTVVFEQLLWVDALRGWNGTGVFKLNHQNHIDLLKVPNAPPKFFEAVDHYNYSYFGQLLVGHNRATTKGKNIYEHTHPFQEEHITLVHNGTLFNHKELGDKEVDSHVICQMLSKDQSPQDLVDNISGAYALLWYDSKVKRLFALRNNDRPLYVIKTTDYFVLVSELEMGLWILNRNNIKVLSSHLMSPFQLYEFQPGNSYKVTKLKENKPKYNLVPEKKSIHGFPTKNILGFSVGEEIEVKTLYCNYGLSEFGDCWGHVKDDPKVTVKYWSKVDYTDVDVTVQIQSFIDMPETNYILGKDPKELPNTDEDASFIITDSNFLDEGDHVKTANGVELTAGVIRLAKDCSCITCSADFIYSTGITLYPQRKNGHVYKYTYYCPDCTKKLHLSPTEYQKQLRLVV